MLDVFNERKPQGLDVVKVKERGGYYILKVAYEGTETETHLQKACAPNCAEKNCDFTICAVMAGIAFDKGDMATVKQWLDKQSKIFTLI